MISEDRCKITRTARHAWLAAIVVVAGACSCEDRAEDSTYRDTESDVDTSTNTDSQTESNTDSQTESNTDSQTESDTDTVPKGDCENGWCTIPPGTFILGSPPSEPCRGAYTEEQVEVTLTRPFLIKQTEITRAEWVALGFPDPSRGNDDMNSPVNFLNWFDAAAYSNRLSEAENLETCYDLSNCTGEVGTGCPDPPDTPLDFVGCGKEEKDTLHCEAPIRKYERMYDCRGYRLPTSAEWEYAARAGTTTATYLGELTTVYSSGCVSDSGVDAIGWHCGNTKSPEIVKQKLPNNFGLYDIIGNVGEWTDYVYTGLSLEWGEGKDGPLTDPMGAAEDVSSRRDARGGMFASVPCICKSAAHYANSHYYRVSFYGFRPVRTLHETPQDAGPDGG